MKIFFLRYGKRSSLFLDRYSETKPFRADCNLAGGRRGAIKKTAEAVFWIYGARTNGFAGTAEGYRDGKVRRVGFIRGSC